MLLANVLFRFILFILLRQPINTVLLLNKYELRIYEKINLKYPALVGVDVSGGYQRDSSAITVVDSFSTRVTAELNSNFISTPELSMVIFEIVSKWLPNAVVNIERNGVAERQSQYVE